MCVPVHSASTYAKTYIQRISLSRSSTAGNDPLPMSKHGPPVRSHPMLQ